ncbi:MAG: ISL3 family transposase [Candidatus Hydrogenedentes bacterium]|nr:ISL3 family transposase [Candidatus Hydrogenedentota bacterium]
MLRIEIPVRPRKDSQGVCSVCGRRGPAYDRLSERSFQYVPLWGIPVILLYALRRIECGACGVKAERVPWSAGKSPVTQTLALFLADWAKMLSWEDVGRRFQVNWHQVFESVRYVVEWGLAHRDMGGITAIGVDEIQFGRGQQYLTVVYQLCGEARRLLYVGKNRETVSFSTFFDEMGKAWCEGITHVCSDMWRAYLNVIKTRLPNAMHVLDRFHIVKLLNEAVDKVRRQEAAELRKQGIDLLKGLKYVFLKRPVNLTETQAGKLMGLMGKRWLRTVRAYLWKEKFQLFWEYTSPYWAQRYLRRWCKGAMRSRLAPVKKFVGTIRSHEELIMNWFRAKKMYSSGAVEGMNRKVNLVTRKAYGYRSYEVLKIALFHTLGDLPAPEMTHRF